MKKAILGTKIGMTQVFQNGKAVPVTVVEAGPCFVVQKKTIESDGYEAIQIAFSAIPEKRAHKVTKALQGHYKKANVGSMRHIREIAVDDLNAYEVGQEIKVDIFADGEVIDAIGISKGKGFAGGIKRHNFSRGPMSHGSRYHRRNGSQGAMGPARTFKGTKGSGRMGCDRVTVQNLEVVRVDADRNLILIKGAIPGPRKSLVTLRAAVKG